MTDPLTPAELDAIEARANAATPGPWEAKFPVRDDFEYVRLFSFTTYLGSVCNTDMDHEETKYNADFIAASRTDVPRLVGEVRRLTAELSDIHETHRRIISEQCPTDERHCTCVPALRSELEKVTAERDELKRKLDAITTSHRGK